VAARYLAAAPDHPNGPCYAGAVVLAAVDGAITAHVATGHALRYGAGPVELPPGGRVAMRPDSVFDTASLTKIFTALLVLQQVDKGRLDLAAPVGTYLPEFRTGGRQSVTLSMLLAHTSGLPVGIDMSGLSGATERRSKILNTPLVSGAVPGRTFRYSSAGPMVLAVLLEKLAGQPFDALVRSGLTGPLGLRDTGFRPLDWLSDRNRLVATDARTARGLLRGVVHDGNAAAMGGVAGHAGIFSTVADLAVIGQLLLGGGEYGGTRILSETTVRRMLTNANPGLPVIDADHPSRPSSHGMGVSLDQSWYMGRLSAPTTFGHTGFTGTSIVVDPRRRAVLVVLTNRAHPDWTRANPDPVRVAAANVLAGAL